jgi:hypothetical protein
MNKQSTVTTSRELQIATVFITVSIVLTGNMRIMIGA